MKANELPAKVKLLAVMGELYVNSFADAELLAAAYESVYDKRPRIALQMSVCGVGVRK